MIRYEKVDEISRVIFRNGLFRNGGKMKVLFISLGCDKNLVDTEYMLGLLKERGFSMTNEEADADAIVVNTCCFIHDAK